MPSITSAIVPLCLIVVLPLELNLIPTIVAAIGGTIPRSILHIQIEKEGNLELGLYDCFTPEASFFGPKLKPDFFTSLESDGVLVKRAWLSQGRIPRAK
jgi:hypothetical protein